MKSLLALVDRPDDLDSPEIGGDDFGSQSIIEGGSIASIDWDGNISLSEQFLGNTAEILFTVFIVIAVAMMVWAGMLLLVAGAHEENKKKGGKILVYTLIAMLLIMFAYTIVSFLFDIQWG